MGLDFGILGPLRVQGNPAIEVSRPSHRRLLSILLLEFGQRVPTDVLIDRFWGDDGPDRPKVTVQTHISALRRLLSPGAIVTEGYGYTIPRGQHRLDAVDFARRAADAQRCVRERDWPAALEASETALSVWRGPPFPELRDDAFARPEIARLEELQVEVLELRAEALLATGRGGEALADLERLVVEHPMRERLWEHLMLARYRSGRHAEALAAYHHAREVLAEIGLEPTAGLQRLQQRILHHDERLSPGPRHNLPTELTTFVGRDEERREVAQLLAQHRMVTLTGVGGAGKTRLAQQVANDVLDAYPDGCWFIALAAVRDPDLVAREVAAAMGLPPRDGDVTGVLRSAVATQTLLIVLDNCEHLLTSCASLARTLLEAGPDMTVVATSREALGVPGEAVYEVPPMALPDGSLDPEHLRRFDAIRLFDDRAQLVRPGAGVDQDPAAVVDICRRLDGVPLAIELAAARVRSLSASTIAERLDDRFRLLTGGSSTAPPRQRTLEATVTWSHDLLSPAERRLFARLSVFRGGFDVPMAEHVGTGDGAGSADVVAVLAGLVDKSLVATYETSVGRRYRLLETLRDYAGDRLAEGGDGDEVRDRHREWCVAFAAEAPSRVLGAGRDDVLARLAADADNLDAALEWATAAGDRSAVAALAGALAWHWSARGHLGLAVGRLRAALDACEETLVEAELRSRLARCYFNTGEVQAAADESDRAHRLVEGSPPSLAKVAVLIRQAVLLRLLVDRDPADAVVVSRAAVAAAEELGDPFVEVRARAQLAQALGWTGPIDEALAQQRTALDLALGAGDPAVVVDLYHGCFDLLYLHPVERREGPARISEELSAWLAEDDTRHVEQGPDGMGWLAYVHLQTGQWRRAEELITRMGAQHLEGYVRTWHRMVRATLRWMQGRTDAARADLDELDRLGVNPRWYHDYYPLLAEVAADEGRVDDVRACADEYVAVEVHPSEESKKLGVLGAVVRAEVDAAPSAHPDRSPEHLRRARRTADRMRQILTSYPPPTGGSLQLETPATYLALAEAELSRAAGPAPDRWRTVLERADYHYTRLYAGWRLAESLLADGQADAAVARIRTVHAQARAVGADGIRCQLEALAARAGVDPAEAGSDRVAPT